MSNNRAYRKWYEDHAEEFNKKRRQRYKEDKAYREDQKDCARVYREKGPTMIDRVGQQRVRFVDREAVTVYTMSVVAKMVGRTGQAIRNWESRGYIPKPTFIGKQRVYTKNQIDLIKQVSEVLDTYRYNPSQLGIEIKNLITKVHEEWGV